MRNNALRFIVTLFIPPALGALCLLVLQLALSIFNRNTDGIAFHEIPSFLLAFSIYGFIFTIVPAVIFFFALEACRIHMVNVANNRLTYAWIGAGLGTLCGVSIGLWLNGLPVFIPIGFIVGFANAWAIFKSANTSLPKKRIG